MRVWGWGCASLCAGSLMPDNPLVLSFIANIDNSYSEIQVFKYDTLLQIAYRFCQKHGLNIKYLEGYSNKIQAALRDHMNMLSHTSPENSQSVLEQINKTLQRSIASTNSGNSLADQTFVINESNAAANNSFFHPNQSVNTTFDNKNISFNPGSISYLSTNLYSASTNVNAANAAHHSTAGINTGSQNQLGSNTCEANCQATSTTIYQPSSSNPAPSGIPTPSINIHLSDNAKGDQPVHAADENPGELTNAQLDPGFDHDEES